MERSRVAVAAALLAVAASAAADPAGVRVRIVNGSADPVPVVQQGVGAVVGDVSVTNVPTVEARQDGPWDVGVPGGVRVTNGAANPIPVGVQGTPTVNVSALPPVSIANTPEVKVVGSTPIAVTQGGPWPVTVQGTPTVALAAGTSLDAAVADPARDAFQAVKTVYRDSYYPNPDRKLVISDPAGRRLVIETVSAIAGIPDPAPAGPLSVETTVGGKTARTWIAMQATGGHAFFPFLLNVNVWMPLFVASATPVRIYSDPTAADPTKHELEIGCGPAAGVPADARYQCIVTVSGRFVNP